MDVIGPDSLLFTGQRVTEVKIIIFASKLLSEVYAWKKKMYFFQYVQCFWFLHITHTENYLKNHTYYFCPLLTLFLIQL